MDLKLLKKARFNTALLALSFVLSTVQSAVAGSIVFAVIGVLATVLTVNDGLELHNSIKGEENGTKTN